MTGVATILKKEWCQCLNAHPIINYVLKSEVAIMLCLYIHYTVLQMMNSIRNFFAKNAVTTENAGEKHGKVSGIPYCAFTN